MMKRFSPRAKTLLLAFLLLALFFLYGGLFYPHPAGLPSGGRSKRRPLRTGSAPMTSAWISMPSFRRASFRAWR